MINKLIEKYNKKLKYITDLKNKTSFELVRVSCLEKEFIIKDIIKDLEELKKEQDYYKKEIARLLADVDENYDIPFDLRDTVDNFVLGVDIDE